MKTLIVSLHDFHPGSRESIREQVAFFRGLGVERFSILVVPDFHHAGRVSGDGESLRFLEQRQAAGDDLVLHGYFHDREGLKQDSYFWTKLYSANEAEFFGLEDPFCEDRLKEGMRIWEEQGWDLKGFIAPGWLMPARQDAILRKLGFSYTTRLKEIVALQGKGVKESRSLCYSTRAAWRRTVSLGWNRTLFGKLRGGDVIRLSMHPNDLGYVKIRRQVESFVRMALANGCEPLTYSDYVSR